MNYALKEVPENYACGICKKTGVKLWRKYASSDDSLICLSCIEKKLNLSLNAGADGMFETKYGRTDQVDMHIPAVPTPDNRSYWGYTSVPDEGVNWWKLLETYAKPPRLAKAKEST